MAKLNGCLIPDDRECQVCDAGGFSVHDLEWTQVHDHPVYLVCPACREKMKSWKPLGVYDYDRSEFQEPERAKRKNKDKKDKKVYALGVPADYTDPEPEEPAPEPEPDPEPEPFTVEVDPAVTLDDL